MESVKKLNGRSDKAAKFQKAYDETLSACNGCHTESGHRFIRIVRPSAPPFTNQGGKSQEVGFHPK